MVRDENENRNWQGVGGGERPTSSRAQETEKPIVIASEEVEKELMGCIHLVAELESRINPFSRPYLESPGDEKEKQGGLPQASAIYLKISGWANTLRLMSGSLKKAIDRLEI